MILENVKMCTVDILFCRNSTMSNISFWNIASHPSFRSWCMWAFWQRNPVMCSVQKCWKVGHLERWSNGQTSSPPFMCWDTTSRFHSQSKNCRGESCLQSCYLINIHKPTVTLVLFIIWWPVQMHFICSVLMVTLRSAQIQLWTFLCKVGLC